MAHYVEVHAPEKPAERQPLKAELLWARSADGECALYRRGQTETLTPEVRLVPKDDGVEIEALRPSVELVAQGVRVKGLLARWGDEVFVGRVRLAFVEAKGTERSQGVMIILLLLALSAALFAFGGSQALDAAGREPAPPALYDGARACSASDPTAAEARAIEAERLAKAKRERYAFDTKDGVLALPLFQESSACFRGAGRIQDAQRLAAAFEGWQEKIDGDYAALQVRLRAARNEGRFADARRVTHELLALLTLRGGDAYAEWLQGLDREFDKNRVSKK
jgi:hypothetical protein